MNGQSIITSGADGTLIIRPVSAVITTDSALTAGGTATAVNGSSNIAAWHDGITISKYDIQQGQTTVTVDRGAGLTFDFGAVACILDRWDGCAVSVDISADGSSWTVVSDFQAGSLRKVAAQVITAVSSRFVRVRILSSNAGPNAVRQLILGKASYTSDLPDGGYVYTPLLTTPTIKSKIHSSPSVGRAKPRVVEQSFTWSRLPLDSGPGEFVETIVNNNGEGIFLIPNVSDQSAEVFFGVPKINEITERCKKTTASVTIRGIY